MDPQIISVLSSIGLAAATAIAGYAASSGIIPSSDKDVLANQLVLVGSGLLAAAIAWYKARQLSQESMITSVNFANNGVKVVPDDKTTAAIPIATKPIPVPDKPVIR